MRIEHGAAVILAVLALVAILPLAGAEDGVQRTFDSAEAGASALIDAAANNDDAALKAIFGPGSEDIVLDGKDPTVQILRKTFAQSAVEKLVLNKLEDGSVEMVIGDEAWPFPVVLVQKDGKWLFDTAEGKEEMVARRIGRNELEAIQIVKGYLRAQREYASKDRDHDGVREFAQKILSSEGAHDGLYWPADPEKGEELSPLGPAVITIQEAISDFVPSKKVPYNGYYWKILHGQGPNAAGGEFSYIINGNMIAGCALIGTPAEYGRTGIMTFIVSNQGGMYEKDLGENSLEVAKALEVYDPGEGWTKVVEQTEN